MRYTVRLGKIMPVLLFLQQTGGTWLAELLHCLRLVVAREVRAVLVAPAAWAEHYPNRLPSKSIIPEMKSGGSSMMISRIQPAKSQALWLHQTADMHSSEGVDDQRAAHLWLKRNMGITWQGYWILREIWSGV